MDFYYNPPRSRNLFNPNSDEPFKLSRSRIDTFIKCPRCFYLDRKIGIDRPPIFPFTLNSAVDTLLKKEFDIHRAKNTKHPLMDTYSVDAVPFQHEKLDEWRDVFKGIQYLHKKTNFIITGAIDDLWINPQKELIIVDYKATSKDGKVGIDAEWQNSYKRQMEIYQWLFRQNEFKVSDTGYFVYCNGRRDNEAFDKKLEFDIDVIPYKGDDKWVEETVIKAHQCLTSDKIPEASENCEYCKYNKALNNLKL